MTDSSTSGTTPPPASTPTPSSSITPRRTPVSRACDRCRRRKAKVRRRNLELLLSRVGEKKNLAEQSNCTDSTFLLSPPISVTSQATSAPIAGMRASTADSIYPWLNEDPKHAGGRITSLPVPTPSPARMPIPHSTTMPERPLCASTLGLIPQRN